MVYSLPNPLDKEYNSELISRYIAKIIHNVLNMEKPYVFSSWGKHGINEDKPLCAFGLVNKESVLDPETRFMKIDVNEAEIEVDTYCGHISFRPLMRDPDFVPKNLKAKFHAEPRFTYAYIGELKDLSDRFGKIKMMDLAEILEREMNANKR